MNLRAKNGFTFIDVIIGAALILVVFLAIFAVFQLGLKVINKSKNKFVATSIANWQLEKIRSLPYSSVGTQGAVLPYASGVLESSTSTKINNIEYTIETKVKFISDGADGLGSQDSCDLDYKRAEVKVSWPGRFGDEITLTTDISPKDKIEELSACESQPGGILSVKVFDAFGQMVNSPLIEVFNPETGGLIDSVSPLSGEYDFPLATSTYKVVVSKSGYSTSQTYGIGDVYNGKTIATPEKPNPIVLDGQVTDISFSIDKVSSFSVDTLSPWGTDYFSDSFLDTNKVSQFLNVAIEGGEVNLATSTEGYLSSGYLDSIAVSSSNIIRWDSFSFTDSEPMDTDLNYQIYYTSGTDWYLISDTDLPGNSTGFDNSPVDLSNLDVSIYSQLKFQANFSTNSTSTTPTLKDWQVSWITNTATLIPNAEFKLEGEKIVGQDSNESPIYKYSTTHTSDSQGHINISNLEWDNYTFSVDPNTGLDLVDINPSSQPIGLSPDTSLDIDLYLDSENSLLLTVINNQTLDPIFAATVRLYNSGLGYDKTQYTNDKGQTLFIPLDTGTYNLEISSSGYVNYSGIISVSGDDVKIIKLQQIE